jgi:hypothetical protein
MAASRAEGSGILAAASIGIFYNHALQVEFVDDIHQLVQHAHREGTEPSGIKNLTGMDSIE